VGYDGRFEPRFQLAVTFMQPGLIQTQPYRQMLNEASAHTMRFVNDCLEQGVFTIEPPPRPGTR